ncbi:MAG: thioredoxin [Deltaproteobacteria bacterium]|nr:thioredoxin [Deltaproteobacteria bacterium]
MAIELNRDNYESEVSQSDKPVLVDFWGPQCRPCLALMTSVEELEKEYEGRLKVAKLNAAENRMLCARLRVMGLPTFLFYRDGVEVKRMSGEAITKDQLKQGIEEVIS